MKLNIYLFFNGNCREAFEFYARLFGGTIEAMILNTGSPAAQQVPEHWQEKILHARLMIGDRALFGSDAPPQYEASPAGFRIHVEIEDQDEAARIFDALAEGGKIAMPFEKTFWAERFGMVSDRFGTPWMISCS